MRSRTVVERLLSLSCQSSNQGQGGNIMTTMTAMVSLLKLFFLLVLLLPAAAGAAPSREINDMSSENNNDDMWSQCNCPSSTSPSFDHQTTDKKNHAKMAYLITVHNRRTIHDGAYLLKALMETSHPGNTAVILIHVDQRVGIADATEVAKNETNKNQFLYHESPLRRYIDACLENSCARGHNNNGKHQEVGNAATKNNVLLEVHSHFAPEWSKWSMNEPTLWAMEYLLYHPQFHTLNTSSKEKTKTIQPSWDVFVNLSGDTLPVISAQRISQLFNPVDGPLGNTNFITSQSCATGLVPTSIFHFPKGTMKRGHYFQHDIPKELTYLDTTTGKWKNNVETPIYFGSQWMALTHDFVQYTIRSMSHPNGLGNVLKMTLVSSEVLMTDETFFATLLMNSPFKDTIPKLNNDDSKSLINYPSMTAIRYERMDENNPNAWGKYISHNSLYDIPPKFKSVTDNEGPAKPWGPYFLGLYDLGDIKDSGALFIRKVSWSVDENLVRMLPVILSKSEEESSKLLEWDVLPDIRWPKNGVNIKKPWSWAAEEEEEE